VTDEGPSPAAADPALVPEAEPATGALSFEQIGDGASREEPGLPIGARAPSFVLPDQEGRPVALESLLEEGPVALVFYRSAGWCLYCKMQLVQLQENLAEIEGTGARIVGISCDPVEVLEGYSERSRIGFPLLSDADSKTIDAYQIRNTAGTSREGVAFHATFIVDRAGVVRSKIYQVSYAGRAAVDNLIDALVRAGRAN